MSRSPDDFDTYDFLREPDPLLRAAAEALYEREGSPFSNLAPVHNSVHWRHHDAVNLGKGALARVVDAMVGQDFAVKGSAYADQRRIDRGLKLLPEEKIEFYKLLTERLDPEMDATAQEIVLLDFHKKVLLERPNKSSNDYIDTLDSVNHGIFSRCMKLSKSLGDALERCNLRTLPTGTARSL